MDGDSDKHEPKSVDMLIADVSLVPRTLFVTAMLGITSALFKNNARDEFISAEAIESKIVSR